jgi:trehalose 6-phosphate synthase/phosphatase
MGLNEMIAWYRTADIHLNTPVADGMNLIAKEYIAARSQPGTLIISDTMGAAAQLSEAIIVPPDSPDAIAHAIHEAFSMPTQERAQRWTALRREVESHQASDWAKSFLSSLAK